MIQKVAVIGLGLIGGSLALALKKHDKNIQITGYDFPDVLDKALERNAIDTPCYSLKDAVEAADLVILAVPIRKILFFLSEIAPLLKSGTIVTDVGSVKQSVMAHALQTLPEDITFIGGHPMAGSEKSGMHHADPYLFENATYALCPASERLGPPHEERFNHLIHLIEKLGARIIILEAEKHDRIAAAVSHLPQLLATTLMKYVGNYHDQDDTYLNLAAGGFRDMTRIASSKFTTWKDIFSVNEAQIVDVLEGFNTELQKVLSIFKASRIDEMQEAFLKAQTSRGLIPKASKGFLHPLADVYVYAEDKPGFLYRLTEVIHSANINIKDLELLKIREGIEGVFRIGFENKIESTAAIEALKDAGYEAFQL